MNSIRLESLWNPSVAARVAALATALTTSAQALTFTVGADGSYASIQAGVTAANTGGNNEVHIEAGSYTENLSLAMSGGTLNVTGGWNATFTSRNTDPTSTLISGGAVDRVWNVTQTGGSFTLDGIVIAAGITSGFGGGIKFGLTNTASAAVRHCNFSLNASNPAAGAGGQGGALYAKLQNSAALILDDDLFDTNGVSVSNNAAAGAGIFISAYDSSNISVSNSVFQNNTATATGLMGSTNAAAAGFGVGGTSQISFNNNTVLSNTLHPPTQQQGHASGVFVGYDCSGTCNITLSSDRFDSNIGGFEGQISMVETIPGGNPTVLLRDLLIVRADQLGVYSNPNSGSLDFVNLTVADNGGLGIERAGTLSNSIAFNNTGGDLLGSAGTGNNLIGVDPHFVDAANGDYHIRADSSARDAGTATPSGGLGLFDLDGNPRLFGSKPDIGAYEIGDKIFKDGFQ